MSEFKINRLGQEKSPYLLQHARNPVDWFPWGQEAFERARLEDKPIILSIGYSTCHWCHVMEHESFENNEIAALMNESFISIKVDREERPDLDQVYMTAVTAMTGQGGWPMTVFLTPEKKPFYGGTYFPPYSRWGNPGFSEILKSISHSWKINPDQIIGSSIELTEILRRNSVKSDGGQSLDETTLDQAYHILNSQFDPMYAGFGQAPKFPMGHNLSFLLRYWKRSGNADVQDMVTKTLITMAQGGIYDQLGGGFHRYSTDQEWHVPHFEKMLYDQALLVRAYLDGYQVTKEPLFERIARETLEYVLRELRDENGGFYSAEDADSLESDGVTKREGAFYVWTDEQFKQVLDPRSAEICSFYFGTQLQGNARNDPHQEFTGKNILSVTCTIEEAAERFGLSSTDIEIIIKQSIKKLFQSRQSRIKPHLDDKILVDWNGLMISGFACAAQVFNDERYQAAARDAADFIITHMINKEGRLLHRYRDGDANIVGTLEDYAFFILGLMDLYEASFDPKYLNCAKKLSDSMLELFWDSKDGGFFMTGHDAEELIVRPKEIYDGALPSGNSVSAFILLRLYHLTNNDVYREKAHGVFKSFAQQVKQSPSAYAFCLTALDFDLSSVAEIVIAGPTQSGNFINMTRVLHSNFFPHKVVVSVVGNEPSGSLNWISIVKGRNAVRMDTVVYVCQNQSCRQPVSTAEELGLLLNSSHLPQEG